MARIKEFRGLRPRKDIVTLLAELPYDVVGSKEAREIAGKNEYNFYHVLLPEVDLPEDVNVYDDIVYNKGKENLYRFIDNGILEFDKTENLYLYTLIMDNREQTGLVTCVSIEDYEKNVIKKHELTLYSKIEDRKKHIDRLSANTGLVFLLYQENGSLLNLFQEAKKIIPEYDFIAKDKVRHIFRKISDKIMIKGFKDSFLNKDLYIADGHHRAASAVNVGIKRRNENSFHKGDEEYNWFLSVIFPHNELYIMPYNRVIRDLNGLNKNEFIEKIKEQFSVELADDRPAKSHQFRMYIDGEWHTLIPRFNIPEDIKSGLDAQMLQDYILEPILGIIDPKKDGRIDFIGGIKGEMRLKNLVDSETYCVAFSLFPVSTDELIKISNEDKLMPPKSTWFEPKLRSGLVIHKLD